LDHQDTSLSIASVKDLDVPHFNVEVVKNCVELALEQNSIEFGTRSATASRDKGKLILLLSKMEQASLLSKHDIEQAFNLVSNRVPELSIDIPHTNEILAELVVEAKKLLILP